DRFPGIRTGISAAGFRDATSAVACRAAYSEMPLCFRASKLRWTDAKPGCDSPGRHHQKSCTKTLVAGFRLLGDPHLISTGAFVHYRSKASRSERDTATFGGRPAPGPCRVSPVCGDARIQSLPRLR